MGISECCKAQLNVEYRIEYLHGKDDDYELQVPCLVCSKCGKEYGPKYGRPGDKTLGD
ncbi:hypothetical protein [Effusibacillus consociatus]|uniref:YgiT-type zinc finger protein n=1 Tax=Effusibacillus consociatus TaxID=1117041 RepID=A0ABV9Q4A9_9BACL